MSLLIYLITFPSCPRCYQAKELLKEYSDIAKVIPLDASNTLAKEMIRIHSLTKAPAFLVFSEGAIFHTLTNKFESVLEMKKFLEDYRENLK